MGAAIRISLKEDFGTTGRGGYFTKYGIIRDVIQNHLLQVLTLVAMDKPSNIGGDIRDAKVAVLNAMLDIDPPRRGRVHLGSAQRCSSKLSQLKCVWRPRAPGMRERMVTRLLSRQVPKLLQPVADCDLHCFCFPCQSEAPAPLGRCGAISLP